ncbi:MAG: hypothetical protein OCC46_03380 [Pseudodesulfovibrio sp.]
MTDPSSRPLGRFEHEGVSPDAWLSIRRMVEAWGYVAVLGAVVAACVIYSTWWPLYPAVGILGLLFHLRQI